MEKIKNNRIYKHLMKNNEFTNMFINSNKKVITADANWYINIYDKLDWDQHPHVYDKNFSTEKWVKENAELLADALNMTEEEVTSPSVIEKIDSGITVADCYNMYSDYYKEAHGFRPRGDYLDESSKDAFLEDYHRRMDNLEEIVKEEDAKWQKAVEENDKKIDDVIDTAKEPEDIAKFKDEYRFELSDEAINKLRKGINDKIHEKLIDNIDFYTMEELNQFKDGYYNHIMKEDMKLIDNKIKELEKEEEYENMKI